MFIITVHVETDVTRTVTHCTHNLLLFHTRRSATADGPRDALCYYIHVVSQAMGVSFQTAKVTFKVIQEQVRTSYR